MFVSLLVAALAAAPPPLPTVTVWGVEAPRDLSDSAELEKALERTLRAAGVVPVPLRVLESDARSYLGVCASDVGKCDVHYEWELPESLLLAQLTRGTDGTLTLAAQLRDVDSGRTLDRFEVRGADVPALVAQLDGGPHGARIAAIYGPGSGWSPRVRRDTRLLIPGAVGLAAVTAGGLLAFQAHRDGSALSERHRGYASDAVSIRDDAERKSRLGGRLMVAGGVTAAASAALWFLLPRRNTLGVVPTQGGAAVSLGRTF